MTNPRVSLVFVSHTSNNYREESSGMALIYLQEDLSVSYMAFCWKKESEAWIVSQYSFPRFFMAEIIAFSLKY